MNELKEEITKIKLADMFNIKTKDIQTRDEEDGGITYKFKSENTNMEITFSNPENKIDEDINKLLGILNEEEEDVSENCIYDSLNENIVYFNPYNKNQMMHWLEHGLNIDTYREYISTEDSKNQKIVWKKARTIMDLELGDLIEFNYKLPLTNDSTNYIEGMITNIDYSENKITLQYFSNSGIELFKIYFENTINIKKAIHLGEKR